MIFKLIKEDVYKRQPEEWELVEEVFQSFVSEEDEDETEYCEGEDEDCNS